MRSRQLHKTTIRLRIENLNPEIISETVSVSHAVGGIVRGSFARALIAAGIAASTGT